MLAACGSWMRKGPRQGEACRGNFERTAKLVCNTACNSNSREVLGDNSIRQHAMFCQREFRSKVPYP